MNASFKEQLDLLIKLQEIDQNLFNYTQVLEELPAKLKETKDIFDDAKAEFEGVKSELEAVQKAKKDSEIDVETSAQRLREREARLYAIKTQKEYQATLKEISEGKRLNREREDKILASMEKIEELTKKSTQLNQAFADKEVELGKIKAEVEAKEAEIRNAMKEYEVARPEIVAKIDKVLLRKYDFIRKRNVLAVSPVKGGACQGCLRKITAQMYNEMLRFEDYKYCPNCQRILYIKEEAAAEPVDAQKEEQKEEQGG